MKLAAVSICLLILASISDPATGQEKADDADGPVQISVRDLVGTPPFRTPQKTTGDRPYPSGGYGFFYEVPADNPFVREVSGEAMRQGGLDTREIVQILRTLGVGGVEAASKDHLRVPLETVKAARRALARLRAHRPGFVDLEYRFTAGEKVLLAGREPIPVYEPALFADTLVRSYLGDWDVEIASASEIPDPILHFQRLGTSLSIRVRPVPFAGVAVVEVRATASAPEKADPIDLKHPDFGPIDRAAMAVEEAVVSFVVENGKPSAQVWTGRDGRSMGLDITARWKEPRMDGGKGAILWTPLLTQPVLGFRMVPFTGSSAGSEVSEDWRPFGHVEERAIDGKALIAFAGHDRDVKAVVQNDSSGLVTIGGEAAAVVRDRIVDGLKRSLAGSLVEVHVLDVPIGTRFPPDGLNSTPEGGRRVALVAGSMIPGLPACFVGADERNFLQDWDVEVAQGALIADPIVSKVENGHYLNVRLVEGPEGKPSGIHLDLQFLKLIRIETTVLPVKVLWGREVTTIVPSGDAKPSSAVTRGANWREERTGYTVEKPSVRELRISSALPLDANGRATLRRTAPAFLGEGRELVILISVR